MPIAMRTNVASACARLTHSTIGPQGTAASVIVRADPFRSIVTASVLPAATVTLRARFMRPSNGSRSQSTRSPAAIPARSAGPPGVT
jgi:hypothetical protein